LLIVRDLSGGARRFVELQRVLPGISTEQLRSRLNRMVADGMLTRKRYREVPPRVDYELTERARDLLPILAELARWGYQWAWGSPRPSERVDIGAIFRLAPGLVRPPTGGGKVELTVRGDTPGGEPASYAIGLAGDRATIAERPEPGADARVTGTQTAWIAALSPTGDRDELEITGDRALAEQLLDALAASERHQAADTAVA
jgi:DNA-binding HxlR family transcriptional regulator